MSAPLDFFDYEGGELSCDGVSLAAIAREHGTPAYVYSARGLREPLRELQNGLRGLDALVCFAVKANSSLGVLGLLAREGAGMDLVSGGELYRARKAGVAPERIVFSGVGKTRAEIEQALAIGIRTFNVESVPELELISAVASATGRRAPCLLRFNPDVDAKTHPYISTGLRKNKFGLTLKEALAVADSASRFPGVSLQGISIHIGSQITTLSPIDDAFKRTRQIFETFRKRLPEAPTTIDLGGGLGITYRNEKAPPVAKYCALVRKHFADAGARLIFEPGRLISGNAGVLLTRVLFRKGRGAKDFLIVDAAMNDLMRPALYGSYHGIAPVRRELTKGAMKKVDVVGPVCESSDCFASDRVLSKKLASGDVLAILSAGAYGFTLSNTYNTRPRGPELLVEDGRVRVLRPRETLDDLIRGETV